MSKTLDGLREAIEASGKSRYRIAKETGISEGQLSRLMSNERGLRIETIETLADHLGLRVVLRRKPHNLKGD